VTRLVNLGRGAWVNPEAVVSIAPHDAIAGLTEPSVRLTTVAGLDSIEWTCGNLDDAIRTANMWAELCNTDGRI
jgi:hypothetical protein